MYTRRRQARGLPLGDFLSVTHTGLSVVVPGYRLSVVRDEAACVATVVVTPAPPPDRLDVAAAADALAARARRFLPGWTVVGWVPPTDTPLSPARGRSPTPPND